MHRRSSVLGLGSSAVLARSLTAGQAALPQRVAPTGWLWDAMGELRPEYEAEAYSTCWRAGWTPSPSHCAIQSPRAEALELAPRLAAFQYDRYLASKPEFFVKATSVKDGRGAARGKMAVFYLYQNTVQFGRTSTAWMCSTGWGGACQLTYNTKNHAGVGCWEGGLTSIWPRTDRADERPADADRPLPRQHADHGRDHRGIEGPGPRVPHRPHWRSTRTGATRTRTCARSRTAAAGWNPVRCARSPPRRRRTACPPTSTTSLHAINVAGIGARLHRQRSRSPGDPAVPEQHIKEPRRKRAVRSMTRSFRVLHRRAERPAPHGGGGDA